MSPRVRAVAGFKRFTDPQLITTGRGVVKEMKDNPNFPNPPEELKTLESAVEELSAALAAQVQGGTAATAHKNNKRDAVIELLVKLAHYVEDNCGQNPATLLSSGFQIATNNRAKSPVVKAAILSIDPGRSTELVLKLNPVDNARIFKVEFAPVGPNNTPGDWKDAGLFTNSRSITVGNLVPGTTYVFRVQAFGTTGSGDWSDPVARMAPGEGIRPCDISQGADNEHRRRNHQHPHNACSYRRPAERRLQSAGARLDARTIASLVERRMGCFGRSLRLYLESNLCQVKEDRCLNS